MWNSGIFGKSHRLNNFPKFLVTLIKESVSLLEKRRGTCWSVSHGHKDKTWEVWRQCGILFELIRSWNSGLWIRNYSNRSLFCFHIFSSLPHFIFSLQPFPISWQYTGPCLKFGSDTKYVSLQVFNYRACEAVPDTLWKFPHFFLLYRLSFFISLLQVKEVMRQWTRNFWFNIKTQ